MSFEFQTPATKQEQHTTSGGRSDRNLKAKDMTSVPSGTLENLAALKLDCCNFDAERGRISRCVKTVLIRFKGENKFSLKAEGEKMREISVQSQHTLYSGSCVGYSN
ncbi:unnamed protein product [Hermetia illucens]|uniref:Uncharacterized protein n=1 Tax=Hermetia illucens TaxID=343691 RepID=A0A7R8UPN9_HERIL|nr:unnamed protein product [Hermetia illucens]